jgi:nitrile hydratase subunit beta
MNGGQDLGGMQGFGPVKVLADEAVDGPGRFHAPWERRALAITLAMGGTGEWNIDQSRAARESLGPAQYLQFSYYKIWIAGLERLMRERNLLESSGLATRAVKKVLREHEVAQALARGNAYDRPHSAAASMPAKFLLGQSVRTRQMHPSTHTRLPRYARDKCGTIQQIRGVFVFPDAAALGDHDAAQWLYTVEFEASALWGSDTTADAVCVDCWESYLMEIV